MPAHLLRMPGLVVLVALVYAATGWLSMQVSIPPHYVSLVFIPAGLALGAVLVRGLWALPGVWLGSLGVQWLASNQAGVGGFQWVWLAAPCGAVLQAWLAVWATRRWVGYPGEFDVSRRILLFMLMLLPLTHALNASLSVPLLVLGGVIPADEAWFNWWSWWQGDALGAVLFTPLVLVALGQPAHAWRSRWKTVALPMLAALCVVAVAFVQIQDSERRVLTQRFEQESAALTERLQRRLHAQTDALLAVTRLMEISSRDDPAEFRLSTEVWLNRYAGTQNFGWSPHITHAQRQAFERQASQMRQEPYQIRARDAAGQTFVAAEAESYLPILFVEPLASNRAALGLDVQVLPATARAVRATVASGLPQVTGGIRLVQEKGEQRGVVMYQVARSQRLPSATVSAPAQPLGVVSAVFRMDDVLHAALGELDPGYLAVCLIDPAAPGDRQWLAGQWGCSSALATRTRHFSSLPVMLGERTWLFQVAAGPAFEARERGWVVWGTFTVSLLAVAMLGAFLLVLTGQARRTEQLVVERTRELAESNAGLQQLAMIDALTGLPNRLHWTGEARKAMDGARRHGDRLAVAFVDLDHFKNVNDSLGHSVGDLLLKSVSRRLQACLRSQDVMARQGGDEFVVLLTRLHNRDDATVVATKMVEALRQPFLLQGHEVRVSASVGLDWFEGGEDDIETLLRHADMAMYRAKSAGRNGWCFFSPEMDHTMSQRLMVEAGLRRAILDNELVLHYQPQVGCRTGEVLGVEALVRWQHPTLGLLPPDRFIPQAENSGQIDELGAWVMRRACQQLRAWHAAGIHGLTMAVNVSAVEFARPGFVARLRQVLDETGIEPSQLELEITETALMQALPELVAQMGEITRMGVSLSLDDFGTGYSSLGYLKRLPLHRLKIDKSFIQDVPGDVEDEAIVLATLSMAHALGLDVVAEGVELGTQRDFLADQGCDQIQGWLVARAMDARSFEDWLRSSGGRAF